MWSFLREQASRIHHSLRRRHLERELDREIDEHLALLAERFIRQGLSPEEAGYAARRQFGGITQLKSEFRERSRFRFFEALLQDSSYVLRQFRKSPLFAVASILTLALGIGANTAIFTLVDQLILRLLPIKDPRQVVALVGQGRFYGDNMGEDALSYPAYQTLRDRNQVFSQMMCRRQLEFTAMVHAESEVLTGELVSGNYFPMLGIRAEAGRVFTASDDLHPGAHPVAVISYGYWKSRFAGNRAVVGSKLLINNFPLTIIGVSQPGFDGLEPGLPAQIFVPFMMTAKLFSHDDFSDMFNPRLRWVNVYGRLKTGLSLASTKAGLQPLFHRILEAEVAQPGFAHATPYDREQFLKMWLDIIPGGQGNTDLRRQYQQPLLVLMGVVACVLLIACANLASLLAARSASRQREIAIRLAIGSSRARVIQQLLTESLLLGLLGGTAGIGLAILMVRSLLDFLPGTPTGYSVSASPDLRILCFALGLSLLTGLVFGLVPALQAARPNVADTLKAQAVSVAGAKGQVRFRKALVVLQIMLSLLLLAGASLFTRSLANLHSLDPGFQTRGIVQFDVDISSIGYDLNRAYVFYAELESRLRRLPGVEAAGMATNAVLASSDWESLISVAGRQNQPGEDRNASVNAVSPGYFRTLGIHLLSGRVFNQSDKARRQPVVLVNESFSKHYFGEKSAVGHRIARGFNPGPSDDLEIVGVVSDSRPDDLQHQPRQVFLCAAQSWEFATTVYLKTEANPHSVFSSARRLVHEMEPKAPVLNMKTVEHQLEESLITERMIASLSLGFSILATALSVLGLYGVMAYTVAHRAREIGVRMALGALFGNVIWLVMREVVLLIVIAVVIALPLMLGLGHLIQSELYGIQPTDPISIASAVLLLSAVALLAGFIPARRAAVSDPLRVLRYE